MVQITDRIMTLLYDIVLHLALLVMLPYYIFKALTAGKYRDGLVERLGLIERGKRDSLIGDKETVWFHAVSVGEVRALEPLLKRFREVHGDLNIVLSTVTRTGQEVARAECGTLADLIIYSPLDLSWAVRRTIDVIRPALFVVVEKEVWPNTFRLLKRVGAEIVVVNGTMSDRSFKRYRSLSFFKGVFSLISHYCGRTERDSEKARALGVDGGKVTVTGNIKFDMEVPGDEEQRGELLSGALGIGDHQIVLVAGSTHRGEEAILLESYKALKERFPALKLVIAPRHPERFSEVESLIRGAGLDLIKRSDIKRSDGGGGTEGDEGAVVLLDTLGELRVAYSISDISFVGGSLVDGIGGHNLLEPALYSKAVLYGGKLTTYRSMADGLEASGGGVRVEVRGEGGSIVEELTSSLSALIESREERERIGVCGNSFVDSNRGAAERSLEIIEGFLGRRGQRG